MWQRFLLGALFILVLSLVLGSFMALAFGSRR